MIKVINGSRCNTKTARTLERISWREYSNSQYHFVAADLMETPKGQHFIFIDRSGLAFDVLNPAANQSEIIESQVWHLLRDS